MMSDGRTPKVVVIVPVYADRDTLALCLDALAAQTLDPSSFETVVVDNGRNPRLDDVVKGRANLRVVREDRPGSYAARNTGIETSRAPLLAFTDADCIPAPDWLEHGLSYLRDDDVGLVGGRVELFARDPARLTAAELYEFSQSFQQEMYIRERRFAATANLFTRRAIFDEVGLFHAELRSGGDKEWGFRVDASGRRLVYAPDVVVRHPARRSFRELARKARRTKAGRIERHLRGAVAIERSNTAPVTSRRGRQKKRNRLVGVLLELGPPRHRMALFREAMPDTTRWQRVRVFCLLWGLGIAQLAEAARLRMGGQPPR